MKRDQESIFARHEEMTGLPGTVGPRAVDPLSEQQMDQGGERRGDINPCGRPTPSEWSQKSYLGAEYIEQSC